MKRTKKGAMWGVTLLLLIAATGVATAQIADPTINYQGRAVDGDGNPLAGPQNVLLTVYDATTGGTALFSESHTGVVFSPDGIFTIVIGANTPGGIPQSLGFDQARWLGVTIAGFNEGNELPRLRFYGTPYAFWANRAFLANSADEADSARSSGRAEVAGSATTADSARVSNFADSSHRAAYADSADYADDADLAQYAFYADSADYAMGLVTPAEISYDDDDKPTARIINKTGLALQVEGGIEVAGSPYAVVSSGVDSTSSRVAVAGDTKGTEAPVPGSLYRDNVPLAWARIGPFGTIISDFGVARVGHSSNNQGVYTIYLDNPVAVDKNGEPFFAPVITLRTPGEGAVFFATWNTILDMSTQNPVPYADRFEVRVTDFEFGVDNEFSFILHGRPE